MTKKLFSRFLSEYQQAGSSRVAEAPDFEWPGVARHHGHNSKEGGDDNIAGDRFYKRRTGVTGS